MDVGAHRLIPLFFFGSPDFRLRTRRVAWKKALALDYGVRCHSLGSSGSATPRLSIQSGSGGCESLLQLPWRCRAVDASFQIVSLGGGRCDCFCKLVGVFCWIFDGFHGYRI